MEKVFVKQFDSTLVPNRTSLNLPENKTMEQEYRDAIYNKMLRVLDEDDQDYTLIAKGANIGEFVVDVPKLFCIP